MSEPSPWIMAEIEAAAERVLDSLDRPTGVWMSYADGTRYDNLPLSFAYVDDEGIVLFEVMPPRNPDVERPVGVGTVKFPAKTGLILPFLEGMPDD